VSKIFVDFFWFVWVVETLIVFFCVLSDTWTAPSDTFTSSLQFVFWHTLQMPLFLRIDIVWAVILFYGVRSQKTWIINNTAVRMPNLAFAISVFLNFFCLNCPICFDLSLYPWLLPTSVQPHSAHEQIPQECSGLNNYCPYMCCCLVFWSSP
jgi:hypothetical protein